MFNRVLVANRGEIAVRVIRALHELGRRGGRRLLDRRRGRAAHPPRRPRGLHRPAARDRRATCDIPSLIAAAATTGCEAVHPGYGFLSENPAFVEACAENDLVFVGPSADTMARMGDKVQAKAEMRAADVPVVPGTEGATTLDEARGRRGGGRLPGAAEGLGGRRRARACGSSARPRSSTPRTATAAMRGRGRVRRRQPLPREGDRPRRGTSRSRCSPTARAACSRSASASARSSGATRS